METITSTVTSQDGTRIAYDKIGHGAGSHRGLGSPLFTCADVFRSVVSLDRRTLMLMREKCAALKGSANSRTKRAGFEKFFSF
jgi:hypothetical protein